MQKQEISGVLETKQFEGKKRAMKLPEGIKRMMERKLQTSAKGPVFDTSGVS